MTDPLFPLSGRSMLPVDWTITDKGAVFSITAPDGRQVSFSTPWSGSMLVRSGSAVRWSLDSRSDGGRDVLYRFADVFAAIVTPDIHAAGNEIDSANGSPDGAEHGRTTTDDE